MRLFPPATARGVVPLEDTTIAGGKYAMKKGSILIIQNICAQRDTKVFGEDVSGNCANYKRNVTLSLVFQADEFRPERLLGKKFDELPVRHLLTRCYID
jgi:cytochrome P450/NADPH-cytochrome P450 reductase